MEVKRKDSQKTSPAGQSSQVCRPVVSYRRNHGASLWLFSHQCSGDYLLHGQDFDEDDQRKKIEDSLMGLCPLGILNDLYILLLNKCLIWQGPPKTQIKQRY